MTFFRHFLGLVPMVYPHLEREKMWRWKPCRDDVLDDALRTSEGEADQGFFDGGGWMRMEFQWISHE